MIGLEDFRDRKVYWFWFPVLGASLYALYYSHSKESLLSLLNISLNLLFLAGVLTILFLYTKTVRKQKFLDYSLGLGDIFIFACIAIGFPTITFLVLFPCSLLFSLLAYIFLKGKMHHNTVPLAGFIAVFIMGVLTFSLFIDQISLYQY